MFVKILFHILKYHSEECAEIDKGYFGLLVYFVQTQALITLTLISVANYNRLLQKCNLYIKLLLTFELSSVSNNVCPNTNLTQTNKTQMKFLFLLGIYFVWGILFSIVQMANYFLPNCRAGKLRKTLCLKGHFLNGLIEILKYTYSSLSDVMFYSLLCVTIGDNMVWYHDASVQCFSILQICMIVFGLVFVIPFPLALFIGLRKLRMNQIESSMFLKSLFCPGPFLICWFVAFVVPVKNASKVFVTNIRDKERMSKENNEMFERFRGAYRISDGATQYWESVIIGRRLALCSTILIPNMMIRLLTCILLNIIFLIHHIWIKPFVYKVSNYAEALSLFQLSFLTAINLFKSTYMQEGIIPEGASVTIFQLLNLTESIMLPVLVLFIFSVEIYLKFRKF